MSKQLALDCIALRPTPRWGHTEYSLEYHQHYIRRTTGMELSDPACYPQFYRQWEYDMFFGVHDGLHGDWGSRGRATDMGHAVYAADGSDLHQPVASPFTSPEQVWAFDAVAEYGLPDRNEQVAAYENWWQSSQAANPEILITGGYYKTIISGAIQAFGWEMLLEAASEPKRFEKVLDSIFRFTLFHMEAWAHTTAEVIIQHDDFVWTAGPFLHPDFYRAVIIPRFAELWKPLHAAGKKVLFCSDGTFTEFTDDLVRAGADGFIFEPSNPFDFMVERYGSSHALIGSAVDCREMTFRGWEAVRQQLEETFTLAQRCKGLLLAVGNHIPANISDEMLDCYIGYLKEHWQR